MLKERLLKWKRPLEKSTNQTKHCLICFKEISDQSIYNLVNINNNICDECYKKMNPKFISFKVMQYEAIAIYEYNEELKKLIYLFKGRYDYELRNVFLSRFIPYLKIKYHGYEIVPIPSSKKDDEKRGFNHVAEISKSLGLPINDVLMKTNDIKQSSISYIKRLENKNNLAMKAATTLSGKKVLILDDVYTSGATVLKALNLVIDDHPKSIKILVVSKTSVPNKDHLKKNIK